jgi:hypothetical protein
VAITDWLSQCLLNGHRVIVPAIVYYELKRELIRAGKSFSIARLDAFISTTTGRYIPLSDEALRLAAELWARARQQGRPPADAKDLDVDVIQGVTRISRSGPVSTSEWRVKPPLRVGGIGFRARL